MKENEMEKQEKWRPKINFGLDYNQELKIFMQFWRRDRLVTINALKYLENIEDEKECQKIVENYINNYYNENKEQINNAVEKANQEWQMAENGFYKKVDEIFDDYPWPKGNYSAVGSILLRLPRWINEKKFAFPINDRGKEYRSRVFSIAHEMLHFIAYDYLEKKFGLVPSQWKDEDNSFWQFTENLNVLIENDPEWGRILGISAGGVRQPYPECREQFEKMKPLWDKSKSIDDLVRNILIK